MSSLLRQAEDILEIACSAQSPESFNLLWTADGGLRLIAGGEWSIAAMRAEYGARAVFRVQQRKGIVRVEGQDGVERCLLERRRLIGEQIAAIEKDTAQAVERDPTGPNALILLLAQIKGIGLETAQMLVYEVLSRNLRDRRAVARYAGLTGTPDESGSKRREKGIGKAGNPRVRRGLIQLAWRFLMFQPDAALVRWYRDRTAGGKGAIRKTMIVALARKLLIALWSYAAAGVMPEGVVLKAV